MIQEIKNFGKNILAAITPATLAANSAPTVDMSGKYDWKAQAYSYNVCNSGTTIGTHSGSCYGRDDHDPDGYPE